MSNSNAVPCCCIPEGRLTFDLDRVVDRAFITPHTDRRLTVTSNKRTHVHTGHSGIDIAVPVSVPHGLATTVPFGATI